ncbi:MAG TPA: hypothetical protein VHQ01_04925, partial [Pyrinomonadaceae bacterium]|nr:hypothetical protein [Pyrinomonadaceae bacterium]
KTPSVYRGNMKIKTLVFLLFIVLGSAFSAMAQDTVEIGIEDLKQLRKLAVDRDYEKARADVAVEQAESWKTSAASWRTLYLAEKDRADRVQGGRVEELQKGIEACRDLHVLDSQKLAENEFTIRKLKGQRKWIFATGLGAGAAAGVYGAKTFSF